MGTLIGRYGNRIADGKFTLDGKEYQLPINEEKGARHCNLHGGPDAVHRPGVGDHGGHCTLPVGADVHHLRLLHPQVLLQLQGVLHHLLVFPPVCLSPQGPHGGTLAPVQHPILDAGPVRRPGHLAAQCVQLPDQVALAGAADGGVDGLHAHPGRRQGSLDARVSRADDGHIIVAAVKLSHQVLTSPHKTA